MTRRNTVLRSNALLLGLAALTSLGLVACDEDPIDPAQRPDIQVDASATAFADTDPAIGTDESIVVRITNTGGGALTISSVSIEGGDAAAFTIDASDDVIGTVAPGASQDLEIGFMPMTEGTKTATLIIASNDPMQNRAEVSLRGEASRFQYRQVDRMGIPGLNTVFNHPSGIGPFDKKKYNLASPANDVADYTAQFVTVLGAVGNADPEGTAALLLPDELPVSLAAATTSFATLTGRRLSDDAVDVALTVTVGVPGLQSDNVDANDRAFRTAFPYVAAPNQ